MKFSELKEKTKKWNSLSRVDTLGSYDFYTSIISFESLQQKNILAFKKLSSQEQNSPSFSEGKKISIEQFQAINKVLPLAAHEYTHFVDATSTLWGLRHLGKMNNAYLCNYELGGTESSFHHAKKFFDHVRRIRLPDYYTVINKQAEPTTTWQARTSIGITFTAGGNTSDTPILFTNFHSKEGKLLARSPISTVSILEASAMAQEIILQTILTNSIQGDSKAIEQKIQSQKTLNYIYNHNLTEYSVCAHLVANQTNCKDLFVAFTMCAILTRLVLNLPERAFEEILNKCNIGQIISTHEEDEFTQKIRSGIKARDLGVIYFLLCRALPKDSAESAKKSIDGINTALSKLSLNVSDLRSWIEQEASALAQSIIESKIKSISTLGKSGLNNIKKIDLFSMNIPFPSLDLPPALLGDSSTWLPFNSPKNSLSDLDLDECFNELYEGQEWVERFSEGCL